MFWLWTFLIYGLLLFVSCYIVVEVGQNYYYDEVTPHAGLKVGGTALILAAALTWWNPSSVDMVTVDLGQTALLAVATFVLFVLVLRFHPPHALLLGPVTVVIVSIAAAMAVESLATSGRAGFRDRPAPPEKRTIRKSAGGSLSAPPIEPEEPTPEPTGP